jgi:hypothetical protein
MKTTKPRQIVSRPQSPQTTNAKTPDWFSKRIPQIARAYKRGVDSGHGDLRWFGADQARIMAAGSKFAKVSRTNASC